MLDMSTMSMMAVISALLLGMALSFWWTFHRYQTWPSYRRWIMGGVALAALLPAYVLSWYPAGYVTGHVIGLFAVMQWPMGLSLWSFTIISGLLTALMTILCTFLVGKLITATQTAVA
jgi:hypothetical protein